METDSGGGYIVMGCSECRKALLPDEEGRRLYWAPPGRAPTYLTGRDADHRRQTRDGGAE
ncbi:hypothetical protein [Mangrovactinospora gilvigrisea]|uniref:hypothetical protein n=1 Tax=Mangrovactinospora gilvigrisea TaxID=1428644 RepID=UPI0011147A31|nr:hypothetical protein [Mangrovactinospora gilvigrisea]